MEQFLLVMFAVGTQALIPVPETQCDLTQITSSPCSPVHGGSVYLRLMTDATDHQLNCYKNVTSERVNVFSLRRNKVKLMEAYKNRTEFFINNGTLKITDVERNDSGRYSVEVFNTDGTRGNDIHFILEVKENIYPVLIIVCSALGALLIVLLCCCVCCKLRHRKKSGKCQVKKKRRAI